MRGILFFAVAVLLAAPAGFAGPSGAAGPGDFAAAAHFVGPADSAAAAHFAGPADSAAIWTIRAPLLRGAPYFGETVANGQIGIVSSAQPFQVKDVVMGGAFDLYGRGRVSNILKTFNLVNLSLDIDGVGIADLNQVEHPVQELDMRGASLTTTFDVPGKASVRYTYYALRQLPYTVMVDVSITAWRGIGINAASVMEAPDILRDVQNYYSQVGGISLLTSTASSPSGRLTVAASDAFLFDGPAPALVHETWDVNRHLMRFTRSLRAGETLRFAVVGSTLTSAQDPDPLNNAERLTVFAALQGRSRLLEAHRRAWEDLWQSDILIDGDDSTQRDVHSMLYHLYSFVREGSGNSLSPMGLSGLGYNGHVFWDTELWMFPALVLLQPRMAASLLDYRFLRLSAARDNAYAHGYRGAMFPWESAATGGEETPVWALSGPFEHHISADVGLAAWNYYCVTGDTSWLREKGYPLLSATADFWVSRVGPHGDIDNVVAADEWAENVDNDAFTNAAARENLRDAVLAASVLQLPSDTSWLSVAGRIPILHFPDGVTREHATYHGESIKQADVNLLAFPLHEVMDSLAVLRDLHYYEPRVGEGPAMTQAVFAVLYARLGLPTRAYAVFKAGYLPNKRPPFGVLAETAHGDNPYFATGAGGLLQAMLYGFGGLEITPRGIVRLRLAGLPSRWKSLTLKGIGPARKTFTIIH
ncbi:glycoside hydrolase family 65 protein [Dinghuibacter silviterrae]|uniref:Trehalose/maltose hydrolase-like predicted phosphorylase n=1 Tax=Dinghuibacter silviterrae TaxID=1539049 RepID=A0A4R8DPS5_9BACT|nr:glycoside hydrolase family 65 protein [Dinghuibacter silviterrae]TDW99755.1 trehalose/maltose hydrolase-like predicted phosphorylase [Dinghuibacter silviterrae]